MLREIRIRSGTSAPSGAFKKIKVMGKVSRKARLLILILAVTGTPGSRLSSQPVQELAIIPRPVSLIPDRGYFSLEAGTKLYTAYAREDLVKIARMFRDELSSLTGITLDMGTGTPGRKSIYLELKEDGESSPEAYSLSVKPSSIRISASGPQGIFYGLKSLEQLILTRDPAGNIIRVPCVDVKDYPRYAWRGMHLDVSRHFFTADSIKRYIDFLAFYKYNRFHWHLTDDQGWRIEIKKYPELTGVGAWRKSMTGDGAGEDSAGPTIRYGGYYTQEEIREIVRYASDRFVIVVPEIEMPGHSQAAIAAYPELGVIGNRLEVKSNWGISPNIYNPFDQTFDFLGNVLKEVMGLFPCEYIHIGGDEAIKNQWKTSSQVQKLIHSLGLKDEEDLQSWFLMKIDRFLVQNGKRLIGWDEILDGGLPPDATVMSWRGMEGGIRAVGLGHDVIMCPNTHCYFNFAQAENEPTSWAKRHVTRLEKVYAFDPCPPGLSREQAGHILGAQGCMWTEHIGTFREVENKLFPRLTALSEALWSPEARDFNEFMGRLKAHRTLFDELKINYYKGDIN
jgi:hexosaminidase